MMTDPIADMLTRIRNGCRIERPAVEMPATKLKGAVAQVLKDEGFILDYRVGEYATDDEGAKIFRSPPKGTTKLVLQIFLKYGPEGERVIRHLERASRPGRRLYWRHGALKPVLDGLGIAVLSTSKGVMSDRRARTERLGGEVLCTVW
jgi:small subunit ribosomal protein S8